jgi:hypothetical protein
MRSCRRGAFAAQMAPFPKGEALRSYVKPRCRPPPQRGFFSEAHQKDVPMRWSRLADLSSRRSVSRNCVLPRTRLFAPMGQLGLLAVSAIMIGTVLAFVL